MTNQAMVLAAGLGTRFREVAGDRPKPLVPVGGKPLLDWVLDGLAAGGVERAVVNVHYKGDQVEHHLAGRAKPSISISDERHALLETGGGLIKATSLFDPGPIFCTNTDALLADKDGRPHEGDPVRRLIEAWDDLRMDALLSVVPVPAATGYEGQGDFLLAKDGTLAWPGEAEGERFIFSGLQIIHPRLWHGEQPVKKSTRTFWEAAMAGGRLHGIVHDGLWMHVGDKAGYDEANAIFARLGLSV